MPETLAAEALVNVVTQGAQRLPDTTVLPGGGSVVSWIDDSSGSPVGKLRVYGADGQALTGEITLGAAREVAVAATTNGGFVAVRIDEVGARQNDILGQTYDAAGNAVGGQVAVASVDFRNTPILAYTTRGLEVTGLSDGGYVAGWSSASFDSNGRGNASVVYQVIGAGGGLEGRGGTTLASGRTAGAYDANIAFAEGPGGQVTASWFQIGFLELGANVQAGQIVQRFDLAGQPLPGLSARLDVDIPADGGPRVDGLLGLSITPLADGKVAYAWISGGNLYTSVYDLAAGQGVRTAPVQVNTAALSPSEPQAAALEDGRYAVGWSQNGDIMVQVVSATGTLGAAVRVGSVTAGVQDQLKLGFDNGVLVATWQDASGIGFDQSGLGVKREIVGFELNAQGTAGRDTLVGGPLADVLAGRDGDDRIVGGAGPDVLQGGVGGDVLIGGPGDDSLSGGAGPDFADYSDAPSGVTVDLSAGIASGGAGTDRLSSVESVFGSRFGDRLTGNFLVNALTGGDGDDTIAGDLGDDAVFGGNGVDTLVLLGGLDTYFATGVSGAVGTLVGRLGTVSANGFERVQVGGTTLSWTEFTSQAFDGLRYIASNADLIRTFGADAARGRAHWTGTGQAEGRPLATFDPLRYAASNPDLLGQFGTDTEALTRHWITTGFAAGRSATSFDPLQYGAANADLLRAFGVALSALTRHYAIAGVLEGRPKDGFDPLLYGASNDDLARLYGTDASALFQHWIRSGVYEGRVPDSFSGLQYAAANDDLARLFGIDARAAQNHYLVTGADEGRATFGFDVTAYKLSFPDLAGLSDAQLLNHWLTVGADAGRRGDELFGREQFGTDQQLDPSAMGELKNFTTSGRPSNDRDYFVVGSTQAERITFTVQEGSLADARLEIFDLDGRLVASDVDTGAGDVATVTVTSAGGTVFYAVVSSVSGGEGTFTVNTAKAANPAAPEEGWVI